MSDEALNNHLDWLDKCAEEQANEPQWDSIAEEWTNTVYDDKSLGSNKRKNQMLSEQIRGIANHIIVGLLIDNKIIRLLYSIADEVDRLEDNLERVDGERVQFGDRVAQLKADLERHEGQIRYYPDSYLGKIFFQGVEEGKRQFETENVWMRREIERVGRALFTGTKTGYVGTEEDLHTIGQTVEGVCENNERLFRESEALNILTQNASSISIRGKIRMITIGWGAWKRAMVMMREGYETTLEQRKTNE